VPSYKEILDATDGPADLAVVLIAGAAGLFGDAVLTIHGAPSPGLVSATAAASALGTKKAFQAGRKARKARKRAAKMIKRLQAGGTSPGERERLEKDLQLREEGLISDAELDQTVDRAVSAIRGDTPGS
jgi:hypothetical protein